MKAKDIYSNLEQADDELVVIYHSGNSERETARIWNEKYNTNLTYNTIRNALVRAGYNRRSRSEAMKLFHKKRGKDIKR